MNIRNNVKLNMSFYILMIFVILIGLIGITFSYVLSVKPVNISANAPELKVSFVSANTNINATDVKPVVDSMITPSYSGNDVIKSTFSVSGFSSNPQNTIYDIAIHNLSFESGISDKDLKLLKWCLFKDNVKLSEGNFSNSFDLKVNNRLVLTDIQEDLTTNKNDYILFIWISDNCTDSDISKCDPSLITNAFYGKSVISGNIKLELSTGSKKTLIRNASTSN